MATHRLVPFHLLFHMGFLLRRYAFVIKNTCPLYEQRTHFCVPPESQPPYIVNPVLRTLFRCAISMTEYLNYPWNQSETANGQLPKVLCPGLSTRWDANLSRQHKAKLWMPLSCIKNTDLKDNFGRDYDKRSWAVSCLSLGWCRMMQTCYSYSYS